MEHSTELPQLSAEEIRVLGSLIEKSKTTPDYYPMSVNAITAACNQKSARKPVVDYEESTVSNALQSLKARSLVATAVGGGTRTIKYKHNFTTVFPLNEASLAVLCLLFLRGPLTPGEINSNSGKLHEFVSLDSVIDSLMALHSAEPPLVSELPRQPGQKEKRFAHLFGTLPLEDPIAVSDEPKASPANQELEFRLQRLEMDLAQVKEDLQLLIRELKG